MCCLHQMNCNTTITQLICVAFIATNLLNLLHMIIVACLQTQQKSTVIVMWSPAQLRSCMHWMASNVHSTKRSSAELKLQTPSNWFGGSSPTRHIIPPKLLGHQTLSPLFGTLICKFLLLWAGRNHAEKKLNMRNPIVKALLLLAHFDRYANKRPK